MNEDEINQNLIAGILLGYIKGVHDESYLKRKKKFRRKAFSLTTKKLVLLYQGLLN